jgi:hypothetical protein
MKIFKALLFTAFILGGFTACDKDNESKAIIGTWEGSWGFDFETPSVYEKWEIKKGGELVAINSNGNVMARGEWKVNGFNFEAEYTTVSSHNTYLFSALYSDVAEEITGNWGAAPSSSDGGTFIMHKQ